MSGTLGPTPFDVTGRLPAPGVTVIEASAGTGKTYTLTSLVVRFVAETGVPLSAVLAVTFTKMATGELRDRVRRRLVEAFDALGETPDGPGRDSGDAVLAALADCDAEERDRRRIRLADALADFDSATIATTHGFCQLVLHGLGTAGDTVPGTELLEDTTDLMEEVVGDLYLRRGIRYPREPAPFGLAAARKAAAEVVRNPEAVLVPPAGEDGAGLLRRLAEKAGTEVGRRLQEENLLTYDHLLLRLAGTLQDPQRGEEACRRLGTSYQVVLVDEFQDTDPVQWSVLQRAFGGGAARLVLIGDPKQAVYAFRGADVHSYLQAARSAGAFHSLDTNWRADQPLLDATDAVLSPLQFGHADITFRAVEAPADRKEAGLRGGGNPAPVRFRLVADGQAGLPQTRFGLSKPALRDWVAADVATDIAGFLGCGAEIHEGGGWREVRERDVAVLTRTNAQAVAVRDALRAAGVASVVCGLDSVFRSEGATAWLHLLEALQQPSSRSRASAVGLGPFVGMGFLEAATAPEARWEELHDRLHRWAAVLAARGVAALYRTVTVEVGLPARALAVEGGERILTDLGHVAQLLHAEASQRGVGAPSLRNWLAARIRAAGEEQAEAEDRSRRLDSDAEAVQVLTVHAAKGLEFAVVYCPYMWDAMMQESGSGPVVFHDPAAGYRRTLDVGCPTRSGPERNRYSEHLELYKAEKRGEDLRVLYVALTRARHRLVIWWGRTQHSRFSPLGRLITGRDQVTGEVTDRLRQEPTMRQIRPRLEEIAARASGLVSIEDATGPAGSPARRADGPGPGRPAAAHLEAAVFDRTLDLRWRRASFTSITAAAHDRGHADPVGSEPEDAGVADEPDGPGEPVAGTAPITGPGSGPGPAPAGGDPMSAESPLSGPGGGTAFGTFVHRVLEEVDFAAPDRPAELEAAVERRMRADGRVADPAALVAGLDAALTTPLGPLVGGTRLADIPRADRLDELSFELPVAGGDSPTGEVEPSDIASCLERHLDPAGPLAGYPDRLRDPLLKTALRGYLTGSLDLVFRLRQADGGTRWYLADYKTNRLGGADRPLLVGDYAPAALEAEMRRRHYPLQALIYLVALHRYLRWRQPGYDPAAHLGGVLYLFLRGMAGPATPAVGGVPCGVWSWMPPTGLVAELSDVLDGAAGPPGGEGR